MSLKQYPDPITRGIIEYLAQYARSFIADHTNNAGKIGDIPQPIVNALVFLDKLKSEKSTMNDVIVDNLPNSFSDLFPKI